MQLHEPVMPLEILRFFEESGIQDGDWILDGTVGEGGHSELLKRQFPGIRLLVVDRDPVMLERALTRLGDGVEAIPSNFSEIDRETLLARGIPGLKGILLDLGVSLYHFLDSGRGFGLRGEEPLDMRLSPGLGVPLASDILREASLLHLKKIFTEYGEEKWALKVAQFVVQERHRKRIETTGDLRNLVEKAIPRKFWPKETHPATRIFQALRIEVNQELVHARSGIENLAPCLVEGGRMQVLSFHSLEDRIVKWGFREMSKNGFHILTKKPLIPDSSELKRNRAARSAKLRVMQRFSGNEC